ncbi:hypothetical protein NDU88_000832 [Pleurodeles waltl]|uniref:Uncharacterized protein n=1 Tax=Pleurodeles waltl TaxID=8319 RepID=A0AAV7WIQ6_PLEWA|nr:hypothetical protein NDU88_000832 [Pleurodeles waltl]
MDPVDGDEGPGPAEWCPSGTEGRNACPRSERCEGEEETESTTGEEETGTAAGEETRSVTGGSEVSSHTEVRTGTENQESKANPVPGAMWLSQKNFTHRSIDLPVVDPLFFLSPHVRALTSLEEPEPPGKRDKKEDKVMV